MDCLIFLTPQRQIGRDLMLLIEMHLRGSTCITTASANICEKWPETDRKTACVGLSSASDGEALGCIVEVWCCGLCSSLRARDGMIATFSLTGGNDTNADEDRCKAAAGTSPLRVDHSSYSDSKFEHRNLNIGSDGEFEHWR